MNEKIEWEPGHEEDLHIVENDVDAIKAIENETHSIYGRYVFWLTDEIIEALKAGKGLMYAGGEFSVLIFYRSEETQQ